MKNHFVSLSILSALSVSYCFSSEHIIPPEWDNTLNSINSKVSVLIHNKLTKKSSKTYPIAGKYARYKCVEVPKIRCAGGYNPELKTALKEKPTLLESLHDSIIQAYDTDIRIEPTGSSWRVCGAAVGSIMWDKSKLTQNKTGDSTKINYEYTPNAYHLDYYFFTDLVGNTQSLDGINGGDIKGSIKSYMIINTEQICR